MTAGSRGRQREEARALLSQRDLDGLRVWAQRVRNPLPIIVSLAFDRDGTTSWRALEALGELAAASAPDDLERVRGIVRRFLWLMNDESGGIAWQGPEALGEILARVPELIEEYGEILVSFLDEKPFGPGVWWAVARLAPVRPELVRGLGPRLEQALNHVDPLTRASALRALAAVRPAGARKAAAELANDAGVFDDYDRRTGQQRERTVGECAREILGSLSRAA